MSSPSAGTYKVSAEELARRRIEAAKDRLSRLRTAASALSADVAAANEAYGPIDLDVPQHKEPLSTDPRMWESICEQWSEELFATREELDGERTKGRLDRLAEYAEGLAPSLENESIEQIGTSGHPNDPSRKVRDVLRRLKGSPQNELAERALDFSIVLLESPRDVRFERGLTHLKLLVQRANDDEKRISANRRRIEGLLTQLDGLDTEAANSLRERIGSLDASDDLPPYLETMVTQVRDDAVGEMRRQFALPRVAAALADVGYQLAEDFSTTVVHDGALLDLPSSVGHGVRVRERGGHLQFNVIRWRDHTASADRDVRAEEAFCADLDVVRDHLEQLGVDLSMHRMDEPGQHPLQIVDRPSKLESSELRRPSASPRERRRGN